MEHRLKIFLSTFLLLIFFSMFFCIKDTNAETKSSKNTQEIISEKDLQELIKTLEDPKKRNEFIKKLKALSQAQKLAQEQKQEDLLVVSGIRGLLSQFFETLTQTISTIRAKPENLIEQFSDQISRKDFLNNMLILLISSLGGILVGKWAKGKVTKIQSKIQSKPLSSVLSYFVNTPLAVISVFLLYKIILFIWNERFQGYDIISSALAFYLLYTLIALSLNVLFEFVTYRSSKILIPETTLLYTKMLQNIAKYLCLLLFLKDIVYTYGLGLILILPLVWLFLLVIGVKVTLFLRKISSDFIAVFREDEKPDLVNFTYVLRYFLTLLIWLVLIDEIIQSVAGSVHFYYAIKQTLIYMCGFLFFHYFFDLIYKSFVQSKVYTVWENEVSSNISKGVIKLIRSLIYLGVFLLLAFSIIKIWALYFSKDISALFATPIVSKLINVSIVVAISLALFKLSGLISYVILEGKIRVASELGQRRLRTLMPVIGNGIKVAVVFVGGILALKYLGVDVGPILAGAGIVGLAVGFGAQAFVKDVINGLFIILEEAFHVGDVVEIAGKNGTVEMIGIRTTRLRDLRGNLHIIPNSSIELITNTTKDYSMSFIEIGVAYKEDVDEVMAILKKLGEEIVEDPDWGKDILEPPEILGLDRFEDSQVVITLRFKTRPRRQWAVRREYLRRVKRRFDELNIEIPFPHVTLYMGTGKDGKALPVHVNLKKETKDE